MKTLLIVSCLGLMTLWSGQAWAGGDDTFFKDTIQSMQQRIKQLEDEVRQLKAAPHLRLR